MDIRRGLRAVVAAAGATALLLAGTVVGAAPAQADRQDDVLTTGERLEQGDSLVSPSGRYRLQLDHFGGLSIQERPNWLNGSEELWYSFADDAEFVVLQADGNLVAYRADLSVAWDFGTQGTGTTAVRLQDDRNLVFFDAGGQVVADATTYNDVALNAGQFLLPGDTLPGPALLSRLVMQTDGNLVLYQGSTALWSSRTQGNPGAGAYFQGDGNLVVYSSAETGREPLFDTGTWRDFLGTSSDPFVTPLLLVEDNELSVVLLDEMSGRAVWGSNWDSSILIAGDELDPGDRRTSRGGSCTLVMQADQNLVQYCGGRAVFATGFPPPMGPGVPTTVFARMQVDGNFVAYQTPLLDAGPVRPVFDTGTQVRGSVLVVQDDRNIVVVAPGGRPAWSRLTGPL